MAILTRMPTFLQASAEPAAILAIVNVALTWWNTVVKHVPEPYLDEFFHVPQAQKYCQGDYTWDPKITTPPGLYLVAKLSGVLYSCDTATLRVLNAVALCVILFLCSVILRTLRGHVQNPTAHIQIFDQSEDAAIGYPEMILEAHTAFNIALFPPLFFFSGLFYTDVMSTLLVLLSYVAYLKKSHPAGTIFENATAILIGIMALLFRQTNIFWVAVFPAALSIIDALKKSKDSTDKSSVVSVADVLRRSWEKGTIYDCSVQESTIRDYALLISSVPVAAIKRLPLVLRVTIPYLVLMVLFVGFVVWNGSVVLGDKTAHTATIHIPQMLYIWPYIAFFSAPLLVGPLLQPIISFLPQGPRKLYHKIMPTTSSSAIPALFPVAFWIALGLTAVHFNTVIHPYTLADNRHYVFYVFKILRRHPAIKYLAVPFYVACAWLSMQALAMPSNEEPEPHRPRKSPPTTVKTHRSHCQISFTFIWLVTAALSVITAPLVEPRYFIIPWIMWRLQVPILTASLSTREGGKLMRYDCRPLLETIWLATINIATAYMFLYRTFEWSNEKGKQRFLW